MKALRNKTTGRITIKVKPEIENRPTKKSDSKDYPITTSAKIMDKGASTKIIEKAQTKSDKGFSKSDSTEIITKK